MRIVEVVETPAENRYGCYLLRLNDKGSDYIKPVNETLYHILLAQTEVITLLVSKGCSEDEVAGVFNRIDALRDISYQEGIKSGIEVGYNQATIDPDRG